MLGGSLQVEVQLQQEMIALYDMACQSTGATFQDLQMVASTNKNVSIPTNHTFAKFDLQRLEMLMLMYWGHNEATWASVIPVTPAWHDKKKSVDCTQTKMGYSLLLWIGCKHHNLQSKIS
jgi:hypothetical protein